MFDLLLELYSEEIPANMQYNAEVGYNNIFTKILTQNNLSFNSLKTYSGPCRISILIKGLFYKEKIQKIKGPSINDAQESIDGFCNKYKIKQNNLTIDFYQKNKYFFYVKKYDFQDLKSILTKIIPIAIKEYTWPKSMHWGNYNISWIRPLRNILCLLDNQVLPIKYGHLIANNLTYGHKFAKFEPIKINNVDTYEQTLAKNFVILDRNKRKAIIQNQLPNSVINDTKLLEEVVELCEYPTVLSGQFPMEFLSLPVEVIITSMKKHQRYFASKDENNNLTSTFFFVNNNPIIHDNDTIIAGNEKVLKARLADAKYFYEQDIKIGIFQHTKKLEKVIFHNKLGTLLDKTNRLISLAKWINKYDLATAAKLCKSDLVSQIVIEFPELQGIMGKYYALLAKIKPEIAEAISVHYLPQNIEDPIPQGLGAWLALIDKLDTLVGLYIANERPTSNKDPQGLRRLALGIIKIIIHNKLNINLSLYINYIIKQYNYSDYSITNTIIDFILERAENFLKKQYSIKLIKPILTQFKEKGLLEIFNNITLFNDFINHNNGQNLIQAYKRLYNLIDINDSNIQTNPDINIFTHKTEKDLYSILINKNNKTTFAENINCLSNISQLINDLLNNVTIKTENYNLTLNRLKLLLFIIKTINSIFPIYIYI